MQYLITGTFAVIYLVGMASPCPSVCVCFNNDHGYHVDCSNRLLSSIPKDIPSNACVLWLYNDNVSVIKDNTLSNLPLIESIVLSNSYISEIERGALNNLPVLQRIHLDSNEITRVEAWFFSGMANINTITMQSNNISFVSSQTFQNLSQLTTLKFTMFCGCNFNIPFWQWFTENRKFPSSIGCYDYPELYLEDIEQSDFYECNEARSTPSTTTSRTTATPANKKTVSPMTTPTMTTTSAARITRKKLDATIFDYRVVIGIAIGVGLLAAVIVLIFVIWGLWIRSKDKEDNFEHQPDKINSMIPVITPSTFPQKTNRKVTVYRRE